MDQQGGLVNCWEGWTLLWERGEGDARKRGWEHLTGSRAIETNGDPLYEDDDGFADAWDEGAS
jgi:hypothetical protein